MAFLDKSVAEVRAKKTGPAGDESTFHGLMNNG
jgi:hypothetical protein